MKSLKFKCEVAEIMEKVRSGNIQACDELEECFNYIFDHVDVVDVQNMMLLRIVDTCKLLKKHQGQTGRQSLT